MSAEKAARTAKKSALGRGLDALISGETDFTGLPALMQRLAAAPAGALCERIRYADHPC